MNIKNKLTAVVITIIAIAGITAFFANTNQINNSPISGVTEKAYVAVENSGEIAVIDTSTNNILKKIDLSEDKNGKTTSYMPHNVQVAPNNKSVWVTANAMDQDMKMSFQLILSEKTTGFIPWMKRILSEDQRFTALRPWISIPPAYADEGHDAEMESNKSSDELIVIDPFADTILKRIEIGQELHLSHVALTPDSSYAIAASQERGIIYKVNAATFEVEKKTATLKGAEPHGLRISPDGKTAYIAMLGGKSLGILDLESFSLLSSIPLTGAAVQTGVTSDGKFALASVYDAKSLAVYDTASEELSYVDLPQEAKGPVQIYPTPDSRYVYIADQGYYFNQPIGYSVYKIDLQQMKVVQTIKGGSAPHGVVVSQDGKFVYVTNLLSDDVSVIDIGAGIEIAKIEVGKMPNGISLWKSK